MDCFVCDNDVMISDNMYYKNNLYHMDVSDTDYHYFYEAVDLETGECIGYITMYELDQYFTTIYHIVYEIDKLFEMSINSLV
jgi:hypothetical protein